MQHYISEERAEVSITFTMSKDDSHGLEAMSETLQTSSSIFLSHPLTTFTQGQVSATRQQSEKTKNMEFSDKKSQ